MFCQHINQTGTAREMSPLFNDQCGLFGQIAFSGKPMDCEKIHRCGGVIAEKDCHPGEDATKAHGAKMGREVISQNWRQRGCKMTIYP